MDFLKVLEKIEEENNKELKKKSDTNEFKISSKKEADDFLAFYSKLTQEADEVVNYSKEAIKEYKEKVESYRDSELNRINNQMERILGLLEVFYVENGFNKSVNLINGSIGYRKTRDNIEYDESKMDEIIKKLNELDPDLIRVKYEPIKNDVKKAVESKGSDVYMNGVKIDGLTFVEGEKVFNATRLKYQED